MSNGDESIGGGHERNREGKRIIMHAGGTAGTHCGKSGGGKDPMGRVCS